MTAIHLAHDTSPEQAEAAIDQAAAAGNVDVTLNGFSPTTWAVIAGRLPTGTRVSRVSDNHYKLTRVVVPAAKASSAIFYNLATANERGLGHAAANAQVVQEIRAQLNTGPLVAGYVEAIGWHLPGTITTDNGTRYKLIRDTSTPGRANIAAYVPEAAHLTRVRWHDLAFRWPAEHGGGLHPARSFLSFLVDGTKYVVAHQPPNQPQVTHAELVKGQTEGIDRLTRMLDGRTGVGRHRPAVVLADFNRAGNAAGPGPAELAHRIGGQVVNAARVDNAVVRGLVVTGVHYVNHLGGLTMNSDHGSYLHLTLRAA